MDGLTLHTVGADEMVVPVDLLTSDLTLAEIGAVVCLLALPMNSDSEALGARLFSPEIHQVLNRLKDRGILELTVEGKKIEIKLSLKKLPLGASASLR